MITGKMVKIRFRRHFPDQKQWVFMGKVLEFTENWVTVEGKAIVLFKGRPEPVDIDAEPRILMVPRENIAHIRLLPDDFDITKIKTKIKGLRTYVKVPNAPDTSIGE
jgi:hypothetical protein